MARWFPEVKTRRRRGRDKINSSPVNVDFSFQGRRSRHPHRQQSDQWLAGHVERFVLRPAPAKIRRAQEQDSPDQMSVRAKMCAIPLDQTRPSASHLMPSGTPLLTLAKTAPPVSVLLVVTE